VSSEALTAVGAFLSGAASVAGAFWALRRVRRQAHEDCEERLAAFREGLERGHHEASD